MMTIVTSLQRKRETEAILTKLFFTSVFTIQLGRFVVKKCFHNLQTLKRKRLFGNKVNQSLVRLTPVRTVELKLLIENHRLLILSLFSSPRRSH